MKKKKREGRDKSRLCISLLLFLSWFVYTAGSVGRMDYSASMVAIIAETGAGKDSAGLVASFFFFAYGAGQLVNGLFCHKYDSRFAIFAALMLSCATNFVMPFLNSVSVMKYLWLVNGLAQSVLWSSLVKLQAEYLNEKNIAKCILIMSTTTAAGTFIAYGVSAFNVAFFSWRITFFIAAGLLLAAALCWLFGAGYVQKNTPKITPKQESGLCGKQRSTSRAPIFAAIAFVCVLAIANGFIKDGITTWVPNMLTELFSLETYFSIILTLILPLISILGACFVKILNQGKKNDILMCSVLFAASGGIASLIFAFYMSSLPGTMVVFAFVSCFMAAINNLIVSVVPFRLRSVGRSGLIAGVLDTCCYVGSMLSSSLLGGLADFSGWSAVFLCVMIVAFAGCALSAGVAPYWKKRVMPLLFAVGDSPDRQTEDIGEEDHEKSVGGDGDEGSDTTNYKKRKENNQDGF